MKIIFAGSPRPSAEILKRLHSEGVDIPLVITQPDKKSKRGLLKNSSEVCVEAQSLGIEVVKPDDLKNINFKNKVKAINADFIVVSAYGKILPQWLLEHPKNSCINIHFSLLPKYRGASPIQSSILNGDKKTGVSFMKMNEKMDEGDIAKVVSIKIEDGEDKQSLEEKLSELAANNLFDVLSLIKDKKLKYTKQDNEQASYCKKIIKGDGQINFADSSKQIIAKFYAYKEWPGSYFLFKNKVIKVHGMAESRDTSDCPPGSFIKINKDGITFKTGDTSIVITYLQFPNKNIISSRDAFNSYQDFFIK